MNKKNNFSAVAHPNIAFIKYWGNRDQYLRIPSNGSISMNLSGLETHTILSPDPELNHDTVILNGITQTGQSLLRVQLFMDHLREICQKKNFFHINSKNTYPASAGLASSSAAFAALAVAGAKAFDLNYSERQLSQLARRGSGSAARSIPDGYVEWMAGTTDKESYAFSLASADHWPLCDCIAIVEESEKEIGSTEGHQLAETSPLQEARVADAKRRLEICRSAILNKDFDALAQIIEQDSQILHAVMISSTPSLIYWNACSLAIMKLIPKWRKSGIPVAFTLDAGPNVHVICPIEHADEISIRIKAILGVQKVIIATVGNGARLLT